MPGIHLISTRTPGPPGKNEAERSYFRSGIGNGGRIAAGCFLSGTQGV